MLLANGASSVLWSIGLMTLLRALYGLFELFRPFLMSSKLDRYLHSADGKGAWALVTGSSDGIGKELATGLARRGFNVLLHGRNLAKLERVKDSLAGTYPQRKFRIIVADASTYGAGNLAFDDVLAPLNGINLTVLVNNVGGNQLSQIYRRLDQSAREDVAAIIHTNSLFPTLLTAELLPRLIRNAPSLVINVASLTDNGMPLLSFYGASKTFISALSLTTSRELIMDGMDVEVLGVRVGEVTGSAGNTQAPSLFVPHSTTVAKSILNRVGCGRHVVVPYLPHALQQLGVNLMPSVVQDVIFHKAMADLRREELRRMKTS